MRAAPFRRSCRRKCHRSGVLAQSGTHYKRQRGSGNGSVSERDTCGRMEATSSNKQHRRRRTHGDRRSIVVIMRCAIPLALVRFLSGPTKRPLGSLEMPMCHVGRSGQFGQLWPEELQSHQFCGAFLAPLCQSSSFPAPACSGLLPARLAGNK